MGTFALGVLFAGFAGILNTLGQPLFEAVPIIGLVLLFYLVVAPIEESVKLRQVSRNDNNHSYRNYD